MAYDWILTIKYFSFISKIFLGGVLALFRVALSIREVEMKDKDFQEHNYQNQDAKLPTYD